MPFEINPRIVRGLDYYTSTVFEVISTNLGAQNSLGGGGRYDGLIRTLGGPDISAVGFATGLERVLQALSKQEGGLPLEPSIDLFLIPLGSESLTRCIPLLQRIRSAGIAAHMDYSGRKLQKVMRYANDCKAKFVTIIGENELESGIVKLKKMSDGSVREVPFDNLLSTLLVRDI
ncbi:MAG: histidyl-tRNA synthetase [Bradyrhizobium sp.]